MFRFINEYRKDNNDAKLLKTEEKLIWRELLEDVKVKKQKEFKNFPRQWKFEKRNPLPFLVHFDKFGNIKEKDFWAEFEDDQFLWELYKNYSEQSNFQNNYGIWQFYTSSDGSRIMLFKPFRYPLFELLEDIGIFLLFMILFSLPLYLIIKIFIEKTLKPVEENLKDMEDFVHNAGHELKTPLAVIYGDMQLMKLKKEYSEIVLIEMMSEIEKLNITIEGLMDLADIHAQIEKEEIDVYQEITDILKTYDPQISEKWLSVNIVNKGKVFISAHKGYFHILLSNLISNAIKYNKIWWILTFDLTKTRLIIRDSGVWISSEHHSKIWQRFYKVSKSTDNKGRGIGLSLVKKIADIYNWKLSVENNQDEGTSFIVRW